MLKKTRETHINLATHGREVLPSAGASPGHQEPSAVAPAECTEADPPTEVAWTAIARHNNFSCIS